MSSSEGVCWLTSDLYAEGIVHELSMSMSMSMSMSEQERSGNFFALAYDFKVRIRIPSFQDAQEVLLQG
jgi:hypothetical protein